MRALPTTAWVFGAALALASTTDHARAEGEPTYQVIVNPSNQASSLDRGFVEDAFLKKVTHWADDTVIRPVDQTASSPARRGFSDSVLRRSVDAVKGYWQQRIFSGRDVPPPELDSDDEVVKYILKYEGGIGYVSLAANLHGAKPVAVR